MSRDEAQQRLLGLQEDIAKLQESLAASRTEFRQEQEALRAVDLQINQTSLEVRDLEARQLEHREELERLDSQREEYLASLGARRDQLADVLRAAYRLDSQSRVKLILNQDDPARVNRMLAYYEYFNRMHIERIQSLRDALARLEALHARISDELARLEAVRDLLQESLARLNAQREERRLLIADLDARIDTEAARLRELEANRRDLVLLLERLEDALSDIPADLGARLGLAGRRGQLPMPAAGRVLHAFGQHRGGNLRWQGWLIGAGQGAEVHSVAYGRVAYADWLRGYGLMLIIDHGDGFLSLYGNNEGLLREVGDWVEPGESIGVVGSTPGMSQGLYFELRKDGKAMDPAIWIKR